MKHLSLILVLSLNTTFSHAADINKGRSLAGKCAACHGANGISPSPLWPNLAGQKAAYTAKQIRAFQSGERKDPSMAPMVAALSDEDIENISAYYASLDGSGSSQNK